MAADLSEANRINALEIAAKLAGAALAFAYAGGFVIVNVHLSNNGFQLLGLVESTYLAAGVWGLVPLFIGSILASVWRGTPRLTPRKASSPSNGAAGRRVRVFQQLENVFSAVIVTAMFVPLLLWVAGFVEWWLPVSVATGVVVSVMMVALGRAVALRWVALVAISAWIIDLSYRSIVYLGGNPPLWSLLPIAASVILAQRIFNILEESPRPMRRIGNAVAGILLLTPVYFGFFASTIYPNIPLTIGGGSPMQIRIVAEKPEAAASLAAFGIRFPSAASLSEPVAIFGATESNLMIKVRPSGAAIIVHRSLVAGILSEGAKQGPK